MPGVILIQSLPVEGKGGLEEGGFISTMTAAELIAICKKFHHIDPNNPVRIIGVGATKGLGDEITYFGHNLYKISADSGKIETFPLDLNTLISFSQISLASKDNVTKIINIEDIKADNSDKNALEINHGGAFAKLLEAIGDKTSSIVEISAKTNYIKTRAVCPILLETGKKIEPTADLMTMISGGKAIFDKDGKLITSISNVDLETEKGKLKLKSYQNRSKEFSIFTVRPQTIHEEISNKEPFWITMSGIITGKNMAENVKLKGLHLHCDKGHILDLGNLGNIKIKITPIEKTYILLPERQKNGDQIWHLALTEDKIPALVTLQSWARQIIERKSIQELKDQKSDEEIMNKKAEKDKKDNDDKNWVKKYEEKKLNEPLLSKL